MHVSSFQLGKQTLPKSVRYSLPTPTAVMSSSRTLKSTSLSLSAKSAKKSEGGGKTDTQFVTNKRCPFAQKAWIALEASETPYNMREVSLYGTGGKPDWFWKLNPQGTVPVIAVGDDAVFADSELILNAVSDGRISGSMDGLLQVNSRLIDEEIAIANQWRSMISKQLAPVGKSAVLGGSLPKLRSLLQELNTMVAGVYLVGDKMTVADCAAFPFFWRIDNEFGIGGDGEENLRKWLDTCMETPEIKRTIPSSGWWWWW